MHSVCNRAEGLSTAEWALGVYTPCKLLPHRGNARVWTGLTRNGTAMPSYES